MMFIYSVRKKNINLIIFIGSLKINYWPPTHRGRFKVPTVLMGGSTAEQLGEVVV
jgi:hypothetical protein